MAMKRPLVQQRIALIASVIGVLELLGALGCLITALLFGNVTNTDLQEGQLYAKYYDTSSPTRRYGSNGGTYWWIGIPFLLPGMVGIVAAATCSVRVMIAFMITNILSFFAAIGLAIFVGLFYNLWKVPMKAYEADNCVFEYHEPTSRTFCQCVITDKADVLLMDADRVWIYVQACDEVEIIATMLIIIIAISVLTALLAAICSYIALYGIVRPEKPKNQPRSGFNPLPADFLATQPEVKPMMEEPREERPLQPRDAYDLKPKSYKDDYASQYPPPYNAATATQKRPPSPEEKEDLDTGWL